jgi:DNA helicase-2/ATP-dependent DNA helicase PcrA
MLRSEQRERPREGLSERLLEGLNERQREAASYGGATLLILAGAGTGKTTTLCARAAWLLGEGVPAERILLVTFTRRAARELVGRARSLAARAGPGGASILGGTFHSLAHRFVRLHASALGLNPGFAVLDPGDAADLIDMLRQEHGHAESTRRFPRAQTLLDIYSRVVNSQVPLAETLSGSFPWCEEHASALAELFRAYSARKRAMGLLDLDDLLLGWRALMADEVTGRAVAGFFDHVLVDEYQDVNSLQVEIVAGMKLGGGGGLSVVGDDFQAIYGFRAASARHIVEFPSRFPGAQTVVLEQSYRSNSEILAVANAVSAQDRDAVPRQLWSEVRGGLEPELVSPHDEAAQAREVCERVLAAREEGIDLRAQAVLFRAGHDSALLELELTRRDIPFVKYGGLRYLDAAHVKDLLALLRLVDNPADELSWFRVLQLLDGVGPARARRILDALRGAGGVESGQAQAEEEWKGGGRASEDPVRTATAREEQVRAVAPSVERFAVAGKQVPPSSREDALALFAALAEARREEHASAGAHVERLCAVLAPLIRLRYPDGVVRVMDLDQLAAAARGAQDLRHFVSELVIDPPSSSSDFAAKPHLDEDYLVLSTAHSAKGLEWEAVHLISAYDGNFPADMNTSDEEGVAEERRLFYVALTRARRRLHVYVPAIFHHRPHGVDDAHGYARASRFLTEEVQRCFRHTRADPHHARLPAASGAAAPRRRLDMSVDALFVA